VNKKQKIVLVIMVIVISAMCVYPPFVTVLSSSRGSMSNVGYSFIWDKPIVFETSNKNIGKTYIDASRLLVQFIPILLIGGVSIFLLKERKE